MANRRVRNAWRNPVPFVSSSPSDPEGRTKERRATKLAESPTQPSVASAYDGPARPVRLEGGLSVNRALSVSALRQTGALNRVRPQTVGGQSAYRAAATVSTGTESRRHHVGATRPPVRPGGDRAEGGRGDREPRSQGLAKHNVSTTEPRFEGKPIPPYLQGSSGGRPAIMAHDSPAARLARPPFSTGRGEG